VQSKSELELVGEEELRLSLLVIKHMVTRVLLTSREEQEGDTRNNKEAMTREAMTKEDMTKEAMTKEAMTKEGMTNKGDMNKEGTNKEGTTNKVMNKEVTMNKVTNKVVTMINNNGLNHQNQSLRN